MPGHPLQAVLRLLPGNLYQCPDNPLQVDRLPEKTSGVELDYPVFQDRRPAVRRQTALWIGLPVLAAPLLAWVAHLIPVPFLHGGANTITLLVAVTLITLGFFGRWWSLAAVGAAVVAVPIGAQLVRDMPYALVAEVLALIGTALLADAIVAHYVWLRTAAPVPRARSLAIRAAWRRRWTAIAAPLRGGEGYVVGYFVLLIAGWCILSELARTMSTGDFWAAFWIFLTVTVLGLLWSVALEFLLPPFYGRARYSPRARAGALWRGLVEFCTYNRLNTQGVGVHQSPVGDCTARRYLLAGTVLAWACLWAGVQLREAGLSQVLSQEAEQKLAFRYWQSFMDAVERYSKGDTGPVEGSEQPLQLTPAEQKFLSQLPADSAEDYLRQREAARVAAQEEQRVEEGAVHPARLLVELFDTLFRVGIDVLVPSLWTLGAALGLLFGITSRALAGVEALLGSQPRQRILSSDNWPMLVDRVRQSQDEIEKNSIFLGTNARDDTPILVPRAVIEEHTHILGDSGSGKTTIGLLPLITQLMSFGDASVVVVDLKADELTLLDCLQTGAEVLTERWRKDTPDHPGYPLRWFTTVTGRSSFAFNPLAQSIMPQLSPEQRTDILISALGLNYGTDYGRKYYGDANYDVLLYALSQHPEIQSLAELEVTLGSVERSPLPQKTKEAGSNVRMSVRRLSRIKALNACPHLRTPTAVLDAAIDLSQIFEQPQALYIALPTSAGISNTAEIARIFLYSLMHAAQHQSRPRRQVYLIVDEFQRIVSKNIEVFLQQARSLNISCILSNQSLSDLDSIDADLVPAVRTNTRLRQVFGAGNQADIEDLLATSGETIYGTRSFGYGWSMLGAVLKGLTVSEERGYRLSINDILLATDAPGRNITCIRRGDGYAQFGGMPFVMDAVHHVPKDDYRKVLEEKSWPPADERMLTATVHDGVTDVPGVPPILESDPPRPPPPPTAQPAGDSSPPPRPAPPESPAPEPDQVSAGSTEGIGEDWLQQMYNEQQRDHNERKRRYDERRKQRRKRRKPSAPE